MFSYGRKFILQWAMETAFFFQYHEIAEAANQDFNLLPGSGRKLAVIHLAPSCQTNLKAQGYKGGFLPSGVLYDKWQWITAGYIVD